MKNKIINLCEPKKTGSMSLEQTIASRRSRREFLQQPLSLEQIGQLAWVAQGRGLDGRYRTTPSAGATYPLELFVVTTDGLFHYRPAEHALEQLTDKDLREELCLAAWGQEFIKAAPLTIVFAAEFNRTTAHYGKRGVRYVYMEAGHAVQNVHLQAEAMGLGSVAVGAFEDISVGKVVSLPDDLEAVYMVTIGYYRK
jgi:SagB-type dehydrogenase family enzyme